jgi:hypothetical protein
MIEVTNKVHAYEVDGAPAKVGDDGASVEVKSHWNETGMVVLVVGGKRMKVRASDLLAAVNNAINTARF